jgi:ATP-dependent protease ClpP protease subunit
MKYFDITQSGREADLYIFGSLGGWRERDVDAFGLVRQIEELDADVLRIHIDSMGGSVHEGWAIYNALRGHKAKVITYADGFVASAALYPYLAGDERYANSVSAFYLHEMSTYAGGYAADLRSAADDLDKLTEIGAKAFVEAAGMSREKVLELMAQETWLAPEDALEYGICTAITKAPEETGLTQSVRRQVLQALTRPPVREEKKPNDNLFAKMFAPKGE